MEKRTVAFALGPAAWLMPREWKLSDKNFPGEADLRLSHIICGEVIQEFLLNAIFH